MKKISNVFGRLSGNGGSNTLTVVPQLEKGHRSADDVTQDVIGRVKSSGFVEDLQNQIDSLQRQLTATREDMTRVTSENKMKTSTINQLKDQLESMDAHAAQSDGARISRSSVRSMRESIKQSSSIILKSPQSPSSSTNLDGVSQTITQARRQSKSKESLKADIAEMQGQLSEMAEMRERMEHIRQQREKKAVQADEYARQLDELMRMIETRNRFGCWLCNHHQNLESSDDESNDNDELNQLREEFIEVNTINQKLCHRIATLEGKTAAHVSTHIHFSLIVRDHQIF